MTPRPEGSSGGHSQRGETNMDFQENKALRFIFGGWRCLRCACGSLSAAAAHGHARRAFAHAGRSGRSSGPRFVQQNPSRVSMQPYIDWTRRKAMSETKRKGRVTIPVRVGMWCPETLEIPSAGAQTPSGTRRNGLPRGAGKAWTRRCAPPITRPGKDNARQGKPDEVQQCYISDGLSYSRGRFAFHPCC